MLTNSKKKVGSSSNNNTATNEFLLVQESPRTFYGALYSNEEPPQYSFPTKTTTSSSSQEKTHNLWSSRPIFPQPQGKDIVEQFQKDKQQPSQQQNEGRKRKRKDLPDLFESSQSSVPSHCIDERKYSWDGRKGCWIPIVLTYKFPTNAFTSGNDFSNELPFSFQTLNPPSLPTSLSPSLTPKGRQDGGGDGVVDDESFIVRSPNMKFLGYSRKRGSRVSMSPSMVSMLDRLEATATSTVTFSNKFTKANDEIIQNPFLTESMTTTSQSNLWIDEEIDCMNDFLFSSSVLDHHAADQLLNFPPAPSAHGAHTQSSLSSYPCSIPSTPQKITNSPPIPSSPLPPLFLYDNKPIIM